MNISAEVIADSVANDIRLTTLELNYPLMIHSQAKTHRMLRIGEQLVEITEDVSLMDDPMLSRNAQSNRAMPVSKVLEQVRNNPAMPSHWGKNQAGMQAYEELDPDFGKELWMCGMRDAELNSAEMLNYGYHKQVANRLTMPFQYIKVIVTATEWDNFFKLRLNDADPTMMELARCMKEAMDNSTPAKLDPGEWHLPYIDQAAWQSNLYDAIKCSVARCARVSYNNHDDSSPNISKDIDLADRLLQDGHMSPFEHQATPMQDIKGSSDGGLYPVEFDDWELGTTHLGRDGSLWSSNFKGWKQNRNLINV